MRRVHGIVSQLLPIPHRPRHFHGFRSVIIVDKSIELVDQLAKRPWLPQLNRKTIRAERRSPARQPPREGFLLEIDLPRGDLENPCSGGKRVGARGSRIRITRSLPRIACCGTPVKAWISRTASSTLEVIRNREKFRGDHSGFQETVHRNRRQVAQYVPRFVHEHTGKGGLARLEKVNTRTPRHRPNPPGRGRRRSIP